MCPQTSESTKEHPGHSFSSCPWDKEDGSEKVNIDPAWVESVTAAMQGSGDGDTDAVLAQNLFLQELASDHSPHVMETDDTLNGGRSRFAILTDYTRNCNIFIIFHARYQNKSVLYRMAWNIS